MTFWKTAHFWLYSKTRRILERDLTGHNFIHTKLFNISVQRPSPGTENYKDQERLRLKSEYDIYLGGILVVVGWQDVTFQSYNHLTLVKMTELQTKAGNQEFQSLNIIEKGQN